MRYWFDTEFIEDGKTIDLISIGILAEDGRELYLESSECGLTRASQWVKDNVIVHLRGGDWRFPRKDIADSIVSFVATDSKPEFWAYYADVS